MQILTATSTNTCKQCMSEWSCPQGGWFLCGRVWVGATLLSIRGRSETRCYWRRDGLFRHEKYEVAEGLTNVPWLRWQGIGGVWVRPPIWSSGQSSCLHNGEVLCLLWGTNWIYICYVEESRPPLFSSGQSSWLQNGDVLCFLWGKNLIYICYVAESRPPL
jgi:hypothetical protein